MKILSRQDLTDILYGCAILGTGGGGDLDEGIEYIDNAIALGKTFKLISIDDVPSGEKVCTPYLLGAISDIPENEENKYAGLECADELPMMIAFRRLQEYSKSNYYGTICCELGGSNTAISFYVAAMIDGFIIDADPAGRAVPEITHSTYYFSGLPASPIVTANEFGECFICENIVDDARAEDIVRALSMISRNDIAAIDHALDIDIVRDAVIKGSISKALDVGRCFRAAKEKGLDLADTVATQGGGFVAFRGTVRDFEFRTELGFTFGHIDIAGSEHFVNSTFRIQVKNENLVGYLDDVVFVTIPDLICLIDLDNGEPVTNPNLQTGANVAVVILPAPKEFTSEKGLSVFGPAYVGLDSPYRPAIETHRKVEYVG